MLSSLLETQGAFSAALLDSARLVPAGVVGPAGVPDPQRFAVYRNNVMVSLVDALRACFRVTQRLVGADFFYAMARAYAPQHPPRSPSMFEYGDDFPDFIDHFGPASAVPYLSDVARLERAWREAYHAADAMPLSLDELRSLRAEELAGLRVQLHPSARWMRSPYPVATIWAAHQTDGEVVPPSTWDSEDVLIVRPAIDVHVHRLPHGSCAFLDALAERGEFVGPTGVTRAESPELDAVSYLLQLANLGAFVTRERDPKQGEEIAE